MSHTVGHWGVHVTFRGYDDWSCSVVTLQASVITSLSVQRTLVDVSLFVGTGDHGVILVRAVFTAGFRVIDITVKSSFGASSVRQKVSIVASVASNRGGGGSETLVGLAIGQSRLASSRVLVLN